MTTLPKAYFFDFDGTLVNSIPVLKGVYKKFMDKVGHPPCEEEFQKLNGPNLREIVEYLKTKYRLTDSEESIRDLFQNLFTGLYAKEIALFPGVLSFLERARRQKIRLIVVTSADPVLVRLVLEREGIDGWFETIISSQDVRNGKPHPEVYLSALKKCGLKAEEVVAFEDSENGIRASTEAGISTIKIEDGFIDWERMNDRRD